MRGRQPRPTLFPYTTLFRSRNQGWPSIRPHCPPRPIHAFGNRMELRRDSSVNVSSHVFGELTFTDESRRSSIRSEEHTSELQSRQYLVCRLLLEKKKETRPD